jgi:hypothetical protein
VNKNFLLWNVRIVNILVSFAPICIETR